MTFGHGICTHQFVRKVFFFLLENDVVFATVCGTGRIVNSPDEYPDIITQR